MARRLGRDTLIVLAVSAAVAWLLGDVRMAGGVLGGGVLSAISGVVLYRAVAALGPSASDGEARRTSPARVAAGLVLRHALLLGAGYVIIGRLHLHPLGVLVGVSAVVVAAMMETARSWR